MQLHNLDLCHINTDSIYDEYLFVYSRIKLIDVEK